MYDYVSLVLFCQYGILFSACRLCQYESIQVPCGDTCKLYKASSLVKLCAMKKFADILWLQSTYSSVT